MATASVDAFRPWDAIRTLRQKFMAPLPSFSPLWGVAILAVAVLGATTRILALNEPATSTAKYEVLEPRTWTGAELPILPYLDIAEQLQSGTWVRLYHFDINTVGSTSPL